ncbi:MAG: hypothetical protein ACD_79C00719G0010 [uncultured bacterium]|nr:MAG: hypothetical protein ACD_79C00719G0010 [uncultured bacterium]
MVSRIFLSLIIFSFFISGCDESSEVKKEVVLFPGGKIKATYFYYELAGKRIFHGRYSEFYSSGLIMKKYRLSHGVLNGKFKEYYNGEKLRTKGQYNKGKKVGVWYYFSPNGDKTIEGKFNHDGIILYIVKYYENGRKQSKEIFDNGNLTKIQNWSIDGQKLPDKIIDANKTQSAKNEILKELLESGNQPSKN